MLRAVLFDLDDTLLINPVSTAVPAYLKAISEYASHLVPPETLSSLVLEGARRMELNDGAGPTNEAAFSEFFFSALDCPENEIRPVLESFYREEYSRLKSTTRPAPHARRTVEAAFDLGFIVAVATNPLYPKAAIDQRLEWAGVPVTEFSYDLVTTYEIMHATKSSLAYYREVADLLSLAPDECLMVGDDWEHDIAPATRIGMMGYWINTSTTVRVEENLESGRLLGHGTLQELSPMLEHLSDNR